MYIVMYHFVRDFAHSRYPDIKGMDVAQFRQQINFFKERFTPVTMEAVMRAHEDGKENALPENALLLTFDDGYIDHYRFVLPVLENAGMQGCFFIPAMILDTDKMLEVNKIQYMFSCAKVEELLEDLRTRMNYYRGRKHDYPSNEALYAMHGVPNRFDNGDIRFIKKMLQSVLPEPVRLEITKELFDKYIAESEEELADELYMKREQIADMQRRGMFIGVHGYSHGWLAEMTIAEMKADIEKSLDVMGNLIDRDRWVMNYPYGNYSAAAAKEAKTQGAVLGLTVEPRVASRADNPMLLPRLDCNDFPPKSETYLQL